LRSTLHSMSFSEPYLTDQPISLSADSYSRENDNYAAVDQVGYSGVHEGATVWRRPASLAVPHGMFSDTYEVTQISISEDLKTGMSSDFTTTEGVGLPSFNLYLDGGCLRDGRMSPALIYSSVGQPMKPDPGTRGVAGVGLAGTWLGGGCDDFTPDVEYDVDIAGPVRAVLFHDVGQAFAEFAVGTTFEHKEKRYGAYREIAIDGVGRFRVLDGNRLPVDVEHGRDPGRRRFR
jgi:hypothetical protein